MSCCGAVRSALTSFSFQPAVRLTSGESGALDSRHDTVFWPDTLPRLLAPHAQEVLRLAWFLAQEDDCVAITRCFVAASAFPAALQTWMRKQDRQTDRQTYRQRLMAE